MSRRPIAPADRRFLRSLPMTILFQKVPGHPERLFNELPQLRRLLRDGLISTSYDASVNAITINRGKKLKEEQRRILGPLAEEMAAAEFMLNPAGEAA